MFLYLTVVGAYAVPAEKNETYTMVDTAVFDIPSRTLLFRAPGMHRSKGHSTFVGLDDALRKEQEEGVVLASKAMVDNLKSELGSFQERIKKQPETVRVVHRPGYTGGGAGGWAEVAEAAGWVTFVRFDEPGVEACVLSHWAAAAWAGVVWGFPVKAGCPHAAEGDGV